MAYYNPNNAYGEVKAARLWKNNFRGAPGKMKGGDPNDDSIGWYDDADQPYVCFVTDINTVEAQREKGWKVEVYTSQREGVPPLAFMRCFLRGPKMEDGSERPLYMQTQVYINNGTSIVDISGNWTAIGQLDFTVIASVDVKFSRKAGRHAKGFHRPYAESITVNVPNDAF